MANSGIDVVVSGRFSGFSVMEAGGYAYIEKVYKDLSMDNVLSCRVVSQQSGNALKGALIAGLEGAVIASNSKSTLVEICWKDGGTSLIRASSDMLEKIIATTYMPRRSADKIKSDEKESKIGGIVCAIILAIGWLVLYLIGSN